LGEGVDVGLGFEGVFCVGEGVCVDVGGVGLSGL